MKGISLFGQLLQRVPTTIFARAVALHGGERHAKGFDCWTQLVSMLFCHLARANSLREICGGLASALGKLSHLGVASAPNKSTLSYANAHRPAEIFEDLFWSTLKHYRSLGQMGPARHRFRFKNKLASLDSTTISLCLSLFPWARYRRAKGGVKVHTLLDHADFMPLFVVIDEARRHDRTVAEAMTRPLPEGSILVADRAYNDYRLFAAWHARKLFFVTRLKDNALYEVVQERALPQNRSIRADQVIRLSGKGAADKCPILLRRVVVWDKVKQREIVLVTNHLDFGATTIAAIYKDRWQIEIFFKTLKQTLKIKTFVGTSENALRIQIWTALLAMALLKFLHYQSRQGWSLSNLAALLRFNLFTYRDLQAWLANPFDTPPELAVAHQLLLPLAGLGQPTRA